MSDNLLRLIPTDPHFVPDSGAQTSAIDTLRTYVPDAHDVTATVSDAIEFVDPGANLERVLCSACGTELPMEAWQEAMGRAYDTQFNDLAMVMPCCGAQSSLNELTYDWPAGFARFVLEAKNPNVLELAPAQRARLEEILRTPLRRIWAHY